jgi:outer membrane murein-binding lipoprotein Lpp
MTEKMDAERFEGHPTERQQLEAQIERLRQDANGMTDREAAAQLMMQILALEVTLLNTD